MDMEKLEKLSCLKLSESDKVEIEESIQGIWSMMEDLQSIELPKVEKHEKTPTIFSQRQDIMFNIEEPTSGIKSVDGKFEAPRVVRKK